MNAGEIRAAYCPHCRARQWLFAYKLPRSDVWTCPRRRQPFRLDARCYGDVWGSVFAVWAAPFFAAIWGWFVLTSAPTFFKMLLGLVLFVPIASICLAAPFAMLGAWIGRQLAPRLLKGATGDPGLKRVSYSGGEGEDDDDDDDEFESRRRSYVHDGCGGVTVVSGDDFERIANPFTFVSQTYCAECGEHVSLSEVRWEDTGEKISRYRARVRDKAPARAKLVGYVAGPLGGFLIGAGVGQYFGGGLGALAGGLAGMGGVVAFVTPYLTRWFGGVDFRKVE
jgi:hypothetical protein